MAYPSCRLALALLIASAALASCVGISADTEIRADGSGTVAFEYRVSRLVESMGKLEGTDRWLPLPFEEDEFERSVLGTPGLTLSDFSAKADETDRTVRASVSFSNLNALVLFLNATGRAATLVEVGGRRTLSLRVAEGGGPLDPDLKRMTDAVFSGYAVSLRFRLPSAPTAQGGGTVDAASRRVAFSAAVPELLSSEKPIVWSFAW